MFREIKKQGGCVGVSFNIDQKVTGLYACNYDSNFMYIASGSTITLKFSEGKIGDLLRVTKKGKLKLARGKIKDKILGVIVGFDGEFILLRTV